MIGRAGGLGGRFLGFACLLKTNFDTTSKKTNKSAKLNHAKLNQGAPSISTSTRTITITLNKKHNQNKKHKTHSKDLKHKINLSHKPNEIRTIKAKTTCCWQ